MRKASTPRSPRGRNRSTSVPSAEEQRPSASTQKPAKRDWAAIKRQQREKHIAELTAKFVAAGHAPREAKRLATSESKQQRREEQRRTRVRRRLPIIVEGSDGTLAVRGSRVRYESLEEVQRVLGNPLAQKKCPLPFEPRYLNYYIVSALRRAASWTPIALMSKEESIAFATVAVDSVHGFLLEGRRFRDPIVQDIQKYAWGIYPIVDSWKVQLPHLALESAAGFALLRTVLRIRESPDLDDERLLTLNLHAKLFCVHMWETSKGRRLQGFWMLYRHLCRFAGIARGTCEWIMPPRPKSVSEDFENLARAMKRSAQSRGHYSVPPKSKEKPLPLLEYVPEPVDHLIPFALPHISGDRDNESPMIIT